MGTSRVAIVHDYLTQRGGAERVVLAMMKAFPGARLITSVYDPVNTYPDFYDFDVETMWLDKVGVLRNDPRRALPLLASSFSNHEIKGVDLVLCSSSGWAHGVRTKAPKIVYCHNPARWLYQGADYSLGQSRSVKLMLDVLRPPLTRWDRQATASCTAYLANSTTVQDRIAQTYGIEADVVPPPVGIDPDGPQEPIVGLLPGFLLSVSRGRGYKNAAVIARAVQQSPGERLVMVGGLPEAPTGAGWSSRLRGVSNISDPQLRWLYANCGGLLAVSYEDFGLTPLEANSFGKPAVCLRAGGYLDTMRPGRTGVFVEKLAVADVMDGISRLRAGVWSAGVIKAHADRYSPAAFAARLQAIADDVRELRPVLRPAMAFPAARREPVAAESHVA